MDQTIRNKLRGVVTQGRKLLEEAVSQVLQGQFGISASGKKDEVQVEAESSLKLSPEDQQCRHDLIAHLGHIQALGYKAKDALAQLVREIAFTHLNRLCAYKMMEAREVWVGGQRFRECVSRGMKSQGFQFYLADDQHGEDKKLFDAGKQDVAYRHFLRWLGALLSEEIGVLFSPTDPANRLFPPQRTLDDVLALLNSEDLAGIWTEDETIGWVYQYFTPKELRDQVRSESAAPRNSYELAFRNQFFTPRYVVEFLTDNTLGRIWYEMHRGETKLKEQCRYMVRRPNEVFLAEGQLPPDPPSNQEELSQEELLKQPVHVPHRPKKDPRELRILDPACGSGHFLLYCFDLLLTIYEEAYADPDLGPKLKEDYATLEALRREVPRLILAHNLHGIDIDLRASQIAALALWLRCQRAFRELSLKQDRPKITKSNFVCAEPMPGEKEILDEFLATLKQDRLETLIGRVMQVPEGKRVRATEAMAESLTELVRLVWEKMKLAGEAGSLLKIEEELQQAVRKGQEEWEEKQPLFRLTEFSLTDKPKETYVQFLPGEGVSFWQRAEVLVLEALRDYARHAANGGRLQRQLFVDDAERGFSFIDVCQKRFDVVVMNPPFGLASKAAKTYVDANFPVSKRDLYSSFVERALQLTDDNGLVAAISSRTGFFLNSFQEWRERVILGGSTLTCFVDLGNGVLDTALVATALYVLGKRPHSNTSRGHFVRLLDIGSEDKELFLRSMLADKPDHTRLFHVLLTSFSRIPGSPLAYWVTPNVLQLFSDLSPVEADGREARVGLQTSDDFRFARLWMEIPPSLMLAPSQIGSDVTSDIRAKCIEATKNGIRWVPFAKGGGFHQYSSNQHLFLDWEFNGQSLKEYNSALYGSVSRNVRSESHYFRPGITWSYLPHLRGSFRVMPAGSVFSVGGPGLFADQQELLPILGVLNSDVFFALIRLFMPRGSAGGGQTLKFEVGYIQKVPFPQLTAETRLFLTTHTKSLHELSFFEPCADETTMVFGVPRLLEYTSEASIAAAYLRCQRSLADVQERIKSLQGQVNDALLNAYGLSREDGKWINSELDGTCGIDEDTEQEPSELGDEGELGNGQCNIHQLAKELLSWGMGVIVGRWDARLAIPNTPRRELPLPFMSLPVCSPGMLIGVDGLPTERTPPNYPVRIDGDGIVADDPDHSDDIVRRVREVLELIWKDRSEAIEKEACELLSINGLRDYFRKPGKGGFWDDHVSSYSKSRRKAPIYWLLQSSKKNYGLWLYYHRLDKDILFKARQNYVEPKIRFEQDRLKSLQSQKTALGANAKGAKKFDKDIETKEALVRELQDFAEKLERAAKLNFGNTEKLNSDVVYDPDLNDGVVLNIAPLWELVPWKEAKNYWEELLEGKYEWSSMGKLLRAKGLVT